MFVAVLASAVVLGILAAGMTCWVLAILKLSAGLPLVAWRERRPVPWSLVDLMAVVGVYVLASVVMATVLRQGGWLPDSVDPEQMTLVQRKVLVWANVGISVLLLLAAVPLIAWRSHAAASDFGWSSKTLLADLRLGLIGFVMLAPPVYAVQAVLVQFWPSKHPLMEMFRGTPDPWFFGLLFVAAVIVAPVFEELVFRVLLQGFLEKVCTFRGSVHELLYSSPVATAAFEKPPLAQAAPLSPGFEPPLSVANVFSPEPIDPNPYLSPVLVGDLAPQFAPLSWADDRQAPLHGWLAWVPIAISALVFAGLHGWPDQVPLVLLAVGMGYLYQRTHSIVPSIVVHTLLNGLSMVGLWVQVYELPDKL